MLAGRNEPPVQYTSGCRDGADGRENDRHVSSLVTGGRGAFSVAVEYGQGSHNHAEGVADALRRSPRTEEIIERRSVCILLSLNLDMIKTYCADLLHSLLQTTMGLKTVY